MKKLIMYILILATGLGLSATAKGQVAAGRDSIPIIIRALNQGTDWLVKNQIALRKTLDGSKDEQKPASILWNNDYQNKLNYMAFDGGLKIGQLELFPKSRTALLFYPKIEWHKNNILKDDKKKNNLTGGVNGELHIRMNGRSWLAHPFLTGSFDYKNDFVKQLKATQTKAFLSFNGRRNFQPGATTRRADSVTMLLRYYPYTGIEHYQSVGTLKGSANVWSNRLYLEIYPIAKGSNQYLQLTADYTYRVVIDDNLYKEGNMSWLTLGLNIYPAGKTTLGFGFDYSRGEDPASNFVKTDLLSFGIKLKI